ncbi:MAG TPA: hypothetical protein VGP47_01085, partial [Parachlamydiaceae bacterium]|nr:hypothetical protein [Parachlamydiaceae bacterium]
MFLTGVNNVNDLNTNLDMLNHAASWGSWDVELVSAKSLKDMVIQNRELIKKSVNDPLLSESLIELAKRVINESYFTHEAAEDFYRTIVNILPHHFIFEAAPEDTLGVIMGCLPNNDLFMLALTNSKIFNIAKKVLCIRTEVLLINIFKEYEDRIIRRNSSDIIGKNISSANILEARELFEARLEFKICSEERNAALRKAFLPFCGNGSYAQLKSRFLRPYPIFYEDKLLVNLLFKHMEQNTLPLTTLKYPGNLSRNRSKKNEDEFKYTFAYLEALKARMINPQHLTMEIHGSLDEKLVTAFAKGISHSPSIRILRLDIYDFTDLEHLKDLLQAINENPYIKTIELSLKFWYDLPM